MKNERVEEKLSLKKKNDQSGYKKKFCEMFNFMKGYAAPLSVMSKYEQV